MFVEKIYTMYENKGAESLQKLKSKLNAQSMSILIGSGFSKNVSSLFPSWVELLFDMAKEMFETKIKDEYEILKSIKKSKVEPYTIFLKRKIINEINSIGYLEIVSLFIKQKGYREIVETYIEGKTPHIVNNGKKIILEYVKDKKNRRLTLTKDDLLLHTKLIELPWNNIYTTNYDLLLEDCIDQNVAKELQNKIDEYSSQNNDKLKLIQDNDIELDKLNIKIEKKKHILDGFSVPKFLSGKMGIIDVSSAITDGSVKEVIEKELMDLNQEIFKLRYQNSSAKIIIAGNVDKIIKFKNLITECLSVIKHSSELAIKRNKNIIKLHGSLRTKTDDEFGFDGDTHKHYVISKEDYDSYPQTHEAFTQLMRISLLQESFCLIGFSGVDPNFLAWVSWVRDVLLRKRTTKKGKVLETDKIYLIELTKDLPTADKVLFYQNHRIVHIPLLQKDNIDFLETQTGLKIKGDNIKKEALLILVEYLKDSITIDKPKIALEILRRDEYAKAWSDLPIQGLGEIDMEDIILKSRGVFENKVHCRMPSLDFTYSHVKHTLLCFAYPYFQAAKSKNQKVKISGLISMALQDQFVPYSVFYNTDKIFDKIIRSALMTSELYDSFKLIQIKDAVWCNNIKKLESLFRSVKNRSQEYSDEIQYQKALKAIFNLDFNALNKTISGWNCTPNFIAKKASLQSFIDIDVAIDTLKNGRYSSIQETLYADDLLDFLFNSKDPVRAAKELSKKIKAIENEGLKTIDSNINYIVKDINRSSVKKEEIKPYGEKKFSIGHSMSFSNISPEIQSLQFFGVLIEMGFPLLLKSIYYTDYKDVYYLAKNAYQFVPFPVLFYSLQYSNSDFLKRLGQDYAYSEYLVQDNILIAQNFQRAYFDINTPERFKEHSLIFFSELLVVLKPEFWQVFFENLWKYKLKEKTLFVDLRFHSNDFIVKGLRFIKSSNLISKIICDCIDNLDIENGNTSIQYLYELAHNYWLEKPIGNIKIHVVNKKIDLLIDKIPSLDSTALFVLGNVYVLLNAKQKHRIKQKLIELNFAKIDSDRIWHVILYFADGNLQILNKAKGAILNHSKLWYTGITEKGGSIPYDYISLYRLRKSQNPESGIQWSTKEKRLIFSRLKKSFKAIQMFVQKRIDVDGYEGVLEEMLYFLQDEMEGVKEANAILRKVNELYLKQRGYRNIIDGLISNDKSNVVWALNEVSKDIYQKKRIIESLEYIELILRKLLVKSKAGMGACLGYLSDWLFDFKDETGLEKYSSQILKVIELYKDYYSEEIDLPFVKEKIAKLSIVLNSWDIKSVVIEEQIKEARNSRFNNLQYALRNIAF